ncbi:MAG: iron chaperone [Acidimicrobiales bacterium]
MSKEDVDHYLGALDEPKRSTLEALRRQILAVLPDAEQCISYGHPAFRVEGKVVAGFAAFKNHLSYLPHSGSVFPELRAELVGYKTSSGALQFPVDEPLPAGLVAKLVQVRKRQALGG